MNLSTTPPPAPACPPQRGQTFQTRLTAHRNTLAGHTALLSAVHGIVRLLGMVNRVILSRWLGAEGMGLLEMAGPAFSLPAALVSGAAPALMRQTARTLAGGDEAAARARFGGARKLLFALGTVSALILILISGWFAARVGDARVAPIVVAYAPSALLLAMSVVYNGWFYGAQRVGPPAVSELIEQGVRVSLVFACSVFAARLPLMTAVTLAAVCTTVGELTGVLHIHTIAGRVRGTWASAVSFLGEMAPYSASRLLSTVLSSVSALMVPFLLMHTGLTRAQAMTHFGTMNGMAAPLLYLPLAVTGSLTTVLAPRLATRQALGAKDAMRAGVSVALEAASAIGVPVSLMFSALGGFAGQLYNQPLAGELLCLLAPGTLLLCLQTTSGNLLNGLGHQKRVFVHTLTHIAVMLAGNALFIGLLRLGIWGYAASFLCAASVTALLNVTALTRAVSLPFASMGWLVRPLACAAPLAALCALRTGVPGCALGLAAYAALYVLAITRRDRNKPHR